MSIKISELTDYESLNRFTSRREEKTSRVLVDQHLPALWEAARDLAQEAFVLQAREAGRLRAEVMV